MHQFHHQSSVEILLVSQGIHYGPSNNRSRLIGSIFYLETLLGLQPNIEDVHNYN